MKEMKGIDVVVKDVYNIGQRVVRSAWMGKGHDERMNDQIQDMKDQGFIVHVQEGANQVLRLLLIMHPDSLALIRKFDEVLVVDATYQTNTLLLPLINIVGFTNLGNDKHLSTFIAATAIVISETARNYTWVLQTFKDVVWGDKASTTKVSIIRAKKN
jgi:hypothetical protein